MISRSPIVFTVCRKGPAGEVSTIEWGPILIDLDLDNLFIPWLPELMSFKARLCHQLLMEFHSAKSR